MQLSQIPTKFNIPWANSAASPYIRPIPQASQIGIQNGAASLTDGFPPLTFLQVAAGGVPPFGEDTNGILNQITSWIRWNTAGGPIVWDSAFSAAIGGYPQYALVQSSTTALLWWISLVDNNTSNPDTGGANWLAVNLGQTIPLGDVVFNFTNGTACTLSPLNGGLLWINGLNYVVPGTGINFSNGSLSANTLYYAYARASGTTIVGDFQTTGYALNANGMPQRIGDATRTLVGFVQTNGAAQFVLAAGQTWVRSWFNRKYFGSRTQFSVNRATTSAGYTEINTEIRNSFLVWSGENIGYAVSGPFLNGTSGGSGISALSFDSGTPELETGIANGPASSNAFGSTAITGVKSGLIEGLHYATIFGLASNGTTTWVGGASTPVTITLSFAART